MNTSLIQIGRLIMKTEIYLVRHGETEWNALGKFQGCTDISLSEAGIQQASFLKERFKNKFDCIYTSPLSRAYKTAEIICADTLDMEPIVDEDLKEINFGIWEGLTFEQINRDYPIEFKKWTTGELTVELMGADLSLKNSCTRMSNAIINIAKKHIGQRIIIVAHGAIIKAGLIGLFDWKMTMYQQLFLDNTSVSKIFFREDMSPILNTLNDTHHLIH